MLLKSLEIQGFKSFSDRTKFYFDSGVTGIVGPNGCGKSNVIDAIRWVLGEQKTRNLRSEKMENVIFNGTDKRKRANVCEVCITFENNRGLLPPEFPTVAITRRLYRDGDAEYLINNIPCRLKDIHALFLDTGIGSDSYAIIELKMVDEILNDKENSRRNLFEEAAGISRYKLRKKETIRKLEDVQNDLTRLEDVTYEVEKNLQSLAKQVKRTEKYQELRKQYKLVSLQSAFLSTESLRKNIQQLITEFEHLENQNIQCSATIATHESRGATFQQQIHVFRKKIALIQQEIISHTDKIRQKEYEKKLHSEKVKQVQQRVTEIEQNQKKYESDIQQFTEKEVALEAVIDAANEQYDQFDYLIQELEEAVSKLQEYVKVAKLNLDNASAKKKYREQDLIKQNREYDILKTNLQNLERELAQKQQDIGSRQETTDEVNTNITLLDEEVSTLQVQKEKLQNAQNKIDTSIEEEKHQIESIQDALRGSTRTLDAKNNERKLLQSLVNSLEGFPESVRFLKKNTQWSARAVLLADIFSCAEQYSTAVEHFLEPYLNYFVVQTRQEAIDAIALLVQQGIGRARFFVLEDITQLTRQKSATNHPLWEKIQYHSRYEALAQHLFQDVEFCEYVPDWLAVAGNQNILLHNGQIWLGNGQLSGGKAGLFEGKRIGRVSQLEQLESEIRHLSQKNQDLQQQLDQTKLTLQKLNTQRPTQQIEQLNKQIQLKQRDLHALKARENDFQQLIQQTKTRLLETQHNINQLKHRISVFEPQIDELQNNLDSLLREVESQQKDFETKQHRLNLQQQKLNQALVQFEQAKNNIQTAKQEIRFIREQKNARLKDLEKYRSEEQELTNTLHKLSEVPDKFDEGLLSAYEALKNLESQRQLIEDDYQALLQDLQKNEAELSRIRKQKEVVGNQLSQNKDLQNDLNLKLNAVEERLRVEFQIELDQLTEENLFKAGRPALTTEELQAEMINLRTKIADFGEVNLAAIKTHQEIKERYDFMLAQRQDLVAAEADLRNTIQEIDNTAQARFLESFQAIRNNFIQVFRSLFTEKDSCNLVLVNPNDPLESPIDILAQPKGKRPLTINQLSGGEKTLTAISLLFAIYLLKPAPFCIFDEVDAPLDDTNIDKFNNIIRNFSKNSQFIVVTHNKRTMMATNTVFGVTMEEAGISKVLPVDFEKLQLPN